MIILFKHLEGICNLNYFTVRVFLPVQFGSINVIMKTVGNVRKLVWPVCRNSTKVRL